jgi:hypothetical protein
MAQEYTYNSLGGEPCGPYIHKNVVSSGMSNKNIQYVNWKGSTSVATVVFNDPVLSGADKTILDGIVTASVSSSAVCSIDIDTDHSYLGGSVISDNVDENTNGFANALHIDTDGNYIDAHADSANTMPCQALALESGTGVKRIIKGPAYVRDDSWSWTTGAPVYVSASVSGGLTQTAPSSTGNQVQIVGYAKSATVIFFSPDWTITVV